MQLLRNVQGVAMSILAVGLGFGAGCAVGLCLFLLLDQLGDLWPNEPPFQWVGPLLLCVYGGGLVGALLAGWLWVHRARRSQPPAEQIDAPAAAAAPHAGDPR